MSFATRLVSTRFPASVLPALPALALSLGVVACGGGDAPPAAVPAPPPPAPPPVASVSAPVKPAYPEAAKHDVVDTYGALEVHDPYRWLEDGQAPAVKDWSEAENAFARKDLDALPHRDAIGARLAQLMGESSPSWFDVEKRRDTFFALERKPPKQHPFLVVRRSLDAAVDASKSAERVLVDPSTLDASGGTNLDWFVPSFDGRRVAVSLSKGGGERGDVHVFDVASGKDLGDVVPQADGGGNGSCLAWKKDGSGFYYTRGASEADKPLVGGKPDAGLYQRVWFHALGKKVATDTVVVGKDAPAIAQWDLVASEDGRSIVARMELGDGGEYDQWLLGPTGPWKEIAPRSEHVQRIAVGDHDALYVLTTKGASRGKVLRTSLATPSLGTAETVVPEGDAAILGILPMRTRLYVTETVGGPSRVRSLPLPPAAAAGKSEGTKSPKGSAAEAGVSNAAAMNVSAFTLALPPVSAVGEMTSLGGDDVAFSVTSYTQPSTWYRTKGLGDPTVFKTALASTTTADFSAVEVVRDTCKSKDGTEVPLTILRPKDVKLDSANPTLLTGYGGFGITLAPRFRPETLAWIEQGGVYAVANLRGGGELGEEWHRAGNLTHKQNVFDDFYACAERLVESRHTRARSLAIRGGSNGGLLMGAELTQHPEAFRAVVAQVGIYDMLRVERDANGAFNVTEYGSVKDPQMLEALAAYSPYQHVEAGVAYPATLFMTGANDPRVNPYHSRKMVARLQDATSSDAPILLRTSANTGHGAGSPLHAQIEEMTDIDAFLFAELGVTYREH